LSRTISQNIFDIEELEKIKTEETVRVERTNRSLNKGPSNTTYKPIDIKDRHHPNPQEADE